MGCKVVAGSLLEHRTDYRHTDLGAHHNLLGAEARDVVAVGTLHCHRTAVRSSADLRIAVLPRRTAGQVHSVRHTKLGVVHLRRNPVLPFLCQEMSDGIADIQGFDGAAAECIQKLVTADAEV
jgi:hypothetical protein